MEGGWSGKRAVLCARMQAVDADAPHPTLAPAPCAGLADWESAKRWDTLGIAAQVADGSFNWSCA